MTTSIERVAAALADHYRIERELGQGGMATVYLAEDLKHRRKVAVKVLRPELAASLGPDRFFREIEVAAQLQHPHILPLFDSGASGQGAGGGAEFLWYAMPYVDGETLRDRLARTGELPIHDAIRILIEVADALAHAHKHGVAHRDIKPENILLSGRHALVSDFGVAKAVSEATGRQQLTTAGVALGTPAYMAPEQAAADPHLDHRVDIYALGVLAYELLTGRTPFSGRTPAGNAGRPRDADAGAGLPIAARHRAGLRGAGDEVPGQAAGRSIPERRRARHRAGAAGDAEWRHDADLYPTGDGRGAGPDGWAEAGNAAGGIGHRAGRRGHGAHPGRRQRT